MNTLVQTLERNNREVRFLRLMRQIYVAATVLTAFLVSTFVGFVLSLIADGRLL